MSRLRRYSNTAVDTELNGAITASSTSLLVASDTGYPSPPFTVAIDSEIILVTDRAGTTFKGLDRGYDNTIPSLHSDTTSVVHKAIADDFSYRAENVLFTPTWHSLDDEFDDETLTDWTQLTASGSASWVVARNALSCVFASQEEKDLALIARDMSTLAPPVYITTTVRLAGVNENYMMAGLFFSDGVTTSNSIVWLASYQGAIDTDEMFHAVTLRDGSVTNVQTTTWDIQLAQTFSPLHLRFDWLNTNTWRAWVSADGISWLALAKTSNLVILTPSYFGLAVSTWNSAQTGGTKSATFDMFRVYEAKPSWWQEGA